jgi:hypothetical protein
MFSDGKFFVRVLAGDEPYCLIDGDNSVIPNHLEPTTPRDKTLQPLPNPPPHRENNPHRPDKPRQPEPSLAWIVKAAQR